jgi:GT2 family glycosyltransferase
VSHNAVSAPHKEFSRLELPGFRTNNMFYKRDILETLGCFDERFTFQREDADCAFTCKTAGYAIGYCDNAVVYHETRQNEKWDLLKNCWNRRFDPLLYKKHRLLYRKHIGSPFPPGIALILFFQLAIFVSAFVIPCLLFLNTGIALFISAVLALRRNNFLQNGIVWLLRDFFSFFAAPPILVTALTWGNAKFKSFLWI